MAFPASLSPPRRDIAANRRELARLGITHILNASHSKWRGGAEYYEGTGICYLGIEAHDSPTFDMSPYFEPAADFIHTALNRSRGESGGGSTSRARWLNSSAPSELESPSPTGLVEGQFECSSCCAGHVGLQSRLTWACG